MRTDAAGIKSLTHDIRTRHLERLEGSSANPAEIVVCMDIINAYVRIKEEYLNVGDAIIGGK